MTPRDPDWMSRTRARLEGTAFATHLGIEATHVAPGVIAASMVVAPHHTQHAGTVHAGVQATLADHCAGIAAGTLLGADEDVVSVEFKVHLLRPAQGERLRCVARVLKPGRRFSVVEATVDCGDADRPTLKFIGTMASVGRDGTSGLDHR